MTEPLVRVDGLTATAGEDRLLAEVSFAVRAGRVTALVGASGSGKTTAALALLGEAGPGVSLSGRVVVDGNVVIGPAAADVRGRLVAYLPQHPGSALNPARRIGAGLRELARLHRHGEDPRQVAEQALAAAQLPVDRRTMRRFPHQFSGGQRQRIALAQALICNPKVLVLDEPSTGLDSVTRLQLAAALTNLAHGGVGILLLSHDHDLVRALADDVVLLDHGRVTGSDLPPYPTLASEEVAERSTSSSDAMLVAEGLGVRIRRTTVLQGVSLEVAKGGRLGIVGRSGSGKTTVARCLAGLQERYVGRVLLDGRVLPALRRRSVEETRRVQYVWQEVRGSFVEHRPVIDQVARTGERLRGMPAAEARGAAEELLARLGVGPRTAARRPAGLSGGELQRAALARAVLARPDVLVCDEITTALDPPATQKVLELLSELNTALIWIGHDLGLVAAVAEQVVVLDAGRIAEPGSAAEQQLVRAARLGTDRFRHSDPTEQEMARR